MNTIAIDKKQVKMVAHRGVSGLEMENTLAAFVAAGNRSYYGIETDVHVTSDKQIVVIHDDDLKRVAGVEKIVEESTLAELQAIPLYDKVPGTSRTDLRTPILSEYINVCKKYEKKAILELKNQMEPEDVAQIVAIIRECGYLDGTVFISFAWDNLVYVKNLVPEQTVQFLTGECDDALIDKMAANGFDLDIYHKSLTAEMIQKLHAAGIEVNCWTVDTAEEADQYIAWGVDYITSNILE